MIQQIIDIFTEALSGVGGAVGQGINDMMSGLFTVTNGDATTLSLFGEVVFIFGAIALVLGLTSWVTNFVARWAN